jgi:hypothetical protein
MTYAEKLLDPRWQRKRLEVLDRDQFKCILCKDDKHTLQVHHTIYKNNPWDAPLESLKTLCDTCHKAISSLEKALFKLPLFPTKAQKYYSLPGDGYVLERVLLKVGNMIVIVYFASGRYDFISSDDISIYYHFMAE